MPSRPTRRLASEISPKETRTHLDAPDAPPDRRPSTAEADEARLHALDSSRGLQLEALTEIVRELASEPDTERLLDLIVGRAAALFRAAGIIFVARRDGWLIPQARSHGALLAEMPLRPGDGVVGRCAAEARGIIVNDYQEWPRALPSFVELGVSRCMASPLMAENQLVGVLLTERIGPAAPPFLPKDLQGLDLFAAHAAVAVRSAQLRADAERRREAARGLAELSHDVAESLEPEGLAARITEDVRRLLAMREASLYRLDPMSGNLIAIAASSPDGEPVLEPNTALAQGLGVSALAVETGRPVFTPNIVEDPGVRLTPELRARIEASPIRAALAVPLIVRGEVIGTLSLGDRPGRVLDADELGLAQAFADHAALMLEHSRLFAIETARRAQLEVLTEIGRELAGTLETDRLLGLIVERAGHSLGGIAYLYLAQEDGALIRAAWHGSHEAGSPHILPGRGAAGQSMMRCEPILVNDYARWPYALPGSVTRGLTRCMCCPLVVGGRVMGVIVLDRLGAEAPAFVPRDLEALERLAAYAAVALENARLYEAAATRSARLRTLAEVNRLVSASLDLDDVLQAIAAAAARLLRVPVAAFWLVDDGGSALELGAFSSDTVAVPDSRRRIRFGEGVVGWVAAHREGLDLADVFADGRIVNLEWWQAHGLRSFVGAPVELDGQLLAVLALAGARPVLKDQDDRDLLESFVSKTAVALRNARLYREAQVRRRRAEVSADLVRDVGASLDLGVVLRRVTEAARELCGSDLSDIVLRDPASPGRLRTSCRAGPWRQPEDTLEVEPGKGLGGLVLATGRPERTDDYLNDPRISRDFVEFARREGIVANLGAPIRIDGRTEGILYVSNRSRRAFTDDHEAVLAELAEYAAIAIRNAQLFRQEQEARLEAEAGHRIRELIEGLDAIVWEADARTWQFIFVSTRAEAILGYPVERWLSQPGFWVEHMHPEDRDRVVGYCRTATDAGRDHEFEYRMIAADGRVVWLHDIVHVMTGPDGGARQLRGVMVDVTGRVRAREAQERAEALLAAEKQVLELIATAAPLEEVLDRLCRLVEREASGALCAILLTEPGGTRLRHVAAPSLPQAYLRAIDGFPIGPASGSCGTAAHRREAVIVEDIARDPLWADYRDVALAHGLWACWSTPILSGEAQVLGTLALYYRVARPPAPDYQGLVERATHLAGIAIERDLAEARTRALAAELTAQRDRLRVLSSGQLAAREDEARRIAHVLHDEAGQLLASVHLVLDAVVRGLAPRDRERVLVAKGFLDQIETQLRRLSHEVRPTVLDDLGLVPALRSLAEGVAERAGLAIRVRGGTGGRLPLPVETVIYRVVQEALANVTRHARASRVEIEIHRDKGVLRCVVRDDGIGFDPETLRERRGGRGLGLIGMRERLASLDGTLDIESTSGEGTAIRVTLPLPAPAPESGGPSG